MAEKLNRLQELLESTEIRAELDLDEHQSNALETLFSAMQREWKNLSNVRHKALLVGDRKGVEAANQSLSERYELAIADLKKVILPHQMLRLSQIEKQYSLGTLSDCSFGIKHCFDELAISDAQKREIDQIVKANNKEFAKLLAKQRDEIIKARNEMQKELMKPLNDEQTKKFGEIIGEEFFDSHWLSRWFNKGELFDRNNDK